MISFLILKNMKLDFLELEPFKRIYISIKIIPTIKYVELVKRKNFVIATFDLRKKLI